MINYMSVIEIAYTLISQEFDSFEKFKEYLDKLCEIVE